MMASVGGDHLVELAGDQCDLVPEAKAGLVAMKHSQQDGAGGAESDDAVIALQGEGFRTFDTDERAESAEAACEFGCLAAEGLSLGGVR